MDFGNEKVFHLGILIMDDITQELFDAIWSSDLEGARLAVSLGASLNAHDNDGFSVLGAAVMGGLPMVRLLLELGADPNLPNTGGTTALTGASATGDIPIATALLEAGATIGYLIDSVQGTLLNDCLQCGNDDMALLHLQYASKSDLDLLNTSGYTPLMLAVAYRNEKMLNALLSAGADPNVGAERQQGISAVHLAAREGAESILQRLLDAGGKLE